MLACLLFLLAMPPTVKLAPAPAGATLVLPEGVWDDLSSVVRRPLTIRGSVPETVISRRNDDYRDKVALRERYGESYERDREEIQDLIDRRVDGQEFAGAQTAFVRKYSQRPVLDVRGE